MYDFECVKATKSAKHPCQVKQFCINSLHAYLTSLPQQDLHWSNDPTLASAELGTLPIRRHYGITWGPSCGFSFLAADDPFGEELYVDEVMNPHFVYQVASNAIQMCFDEDREGLVYFGQTKVLSLVISGSLPMADAKNETFPVTGVTYR